MEAFIGCKISSVVSQATIGMKRILIAAYNYYPLHSGGTEVYVQNLLTFLQNKAEVLLIVASNEAEVAAKGFITTIIYSTQQFTAFTYNWQGQTVVGINIAEHKMDYIYARYKKEYSAAFEQVLQLLGWESPHYYWMHGFTSVSGISLLQAIKKIQPLVQTYAWLHTPYTCFKDALLQYQQPCSVLPSMQTCTHCFLTDNLHNNKTAASLLMKIPFLFRNLLPTAAAHTEQYVAYHLKAIQELLQEVQGFICFTPAMQQHLLLSGMKPHKLHCIMHGVDTQLFNTANRQTHAIKKFLYAGRWNKAKGFYLLCEAWLELPDEPLTRILSITGNSVGNETAYQQQLIQKMKQRKDVGWLEQLSVEKLADVYKQHDTLIIPSMWIETGPMVFHEAIACGCSVIGSDIGGVAALAKYYDQPVFKAGNKEALKNAIEQAIFSENKTATQKGILIKEHFKQVLSITANDVAC